MKASLQKKLYNLIQEEQITPVDIELLDALQELAAGETIYEEFTPTERNTLNEFFRLMRNYLWQEIISGKYGPQVTVDAIIVLSFEVGFKFGRLKPEPKI